MRVVVGSSVFKLPSVYTAIGVVDSKGWSVVVVNDVDWECG